MNAQLLNGMIPTEATTSLFNDMMISQLEDIFDDIDTDVLEDAYHAEKDDAESWQGLVDAVTIWLQDHTERAPLVGVVPYNDFGLGD